MNFSAKLFVLVVLPMAILAMTIPPLEGGEEEEVDVIDYSAERNETEGSFKKSGKNVDFCRKVTFRY